MVVAVAMVVVVAVVVASMRVGMSAPVLMLILVTPWTVRMNGRCCMTMLMVMVMFVFVSIVAVPSRCSTRNVPLRRVAMRQRTAAPACAIL